MSQQTTLFKHNFTKKILQCGNLVDVTESNASSKQNLPFYCVKCDKPFKIKGALWMHKS